MNATGKRARAASGLTRHQLRKSQHTKKRPGKVFNNAKKRFAKHDNSPE